MSPSFSVHSNRILITILLTAIGNGQGLIARQHWSKSYLRSVSLSASSPLHIVLDSSQYLHRDIRYHPECPERIEHCLSAIRGIFSSVDGLGTTEENKRTVHVDDVASIPSASRNECCVEGNTFYQEFSSPLTADEFSYAESVLSSIHAPEYVSSLKNKCESSRQRRIDEGKDPLGWIGYIDGSDTFLTTESYNVGVRAAGAWIRTVNSALGIDIDVCDAKARDTPTASDKPIGVALTRPPGHHAMYSVANGFCLFNFAMAAAYHAIRRHRNIKISILDWDVHFGQGIMHILEKCSTEESKGSDWDWTSSIRYVSLHQVPCFPFEGQTRKVQGRNKNVLTLPIQPDSTWHCGYREMFTKYALPFISTSSEWEPDLVIVSAGYDALDSDELASVNLVATDYGEMTKIFLHHIDESASTKPALIFGLEVIVPDVIVNVRRADRFGALLL
eukprot:CCRYP_011818-RA/>CCRYP_011818-RA protein AED:0.23 eAED:-0.31 QI:0/0/0/0.5/1/1/2/0/446